MSLLQNSNSVTSSTGYDIEKSCRFYRGWLTKTFASAGNLDKYTVSVWMKNNGYDVGSVYGNNSILYAQSDLNDKTQIWSHGTSGPAFQNMIAGGLSGGILGNYQKLRDPASWYHYVFIWDSGNATSGDRMQIWKNGVRLTGFSANSVDETYPAQNQDSIGINQAFEHGIGLYRSEGGSQYYNECYFAEYYFLDGQALNASSFGEFDAVNQWVPIEAKDDLTFGSNGFFLEFKNAAALGEDTSGNDNDFAVNSIDANDQMIDTPTNNFATINPLIKSYSTPNTISEGNLKIDQADDYNQWASTWAVKTGKWYCEFRCGDAGSAGFGIIADNATKWWDNQLSPQNGSGHILYTKDGVKNIDGTETSYGDSFTDGDIIGMAVNLTDSEVTYYKNGTVQNSGTAISFSGGILNANLIIPGAMTKNGTTYFNGGSDSSFSGTETAQGNGGAGEDFYYTPPTGYKGLNTDNLSAPEIALPGENFNTVIWTGNDADNRPITGLGFSPDITWNKRRSAGGNHQLQDVIRGAPEVLTPNQPYAEATEANSTKSFDADGFTVGTDSNANGNGITYVAWCWKAGGTPTATNSAGAGNTPTAGSVKINGSNLGSALAGSIPATKLSANTTSGFSIVEYSGVDTPATNTVAHGLSVAPELYIIKSVGAASPLGWIANTTVIDGTVDYLVLNTNAAKSDQGSPWSTLPTASVFTLGANDGNTCNDGVDYVAYCFHSIEGYSKVGVFTGNANADGPFVYTGFKPAMVIIKQATTSNWFIYDDARDTFNVVEDTLKPSTNDAETDVDALDFVSNGFKLRHNSGSSSINDNGVSIIYLALAESPFKTSNAR